MDKKNKISWGVLSTANIGFAKVIPAMQKGQYSIVNAVASRNLEKAKNYAQKLGIPEFYGSYEELLKDKNIDAVYIPLPNHLHVEWIIKSLEAGKHVLCEKPVSMNYEEAIFLEEQVKKFPGLKVMEAFMYRHHPQWQKVKALIDNGSIGQLKNIHSVFSYYNVNPDDIRNKADIGGGSLLDIGCYCISLSRFLFNGEPECAAGAVEYDPVLKTDRLASGVLEFWLHHDDSKGEKGTATFTCSTQLMYHQVVQIYGTEGRILMDNPFTPPPDKKCEIYLNKKSFEEKIIIIDACDQYTMQGDLFSLSILNNTEVPTPLKDATANMKVIDAIFESAKSHNWITI